MEIVERMVSKDEYLAFLERVDVALDTFPYNGTTTTCEALWMGVPVVTLAGDRHAGRVGASILTRVGLTGLVTDGVEAYLDAAAGLAGDRDRLADLRAGLRDRMENSPLMDGEGVCPGWKGPTGILFRNGPATRP